MQGCRSCVIFLNCIGVLDTLETQVVLAAYVQATESNPQSNIIQRGWCSWLATVVFRMSRPVVTVRPGVEARKCSLNLHVLFNNSEVLGLAHAWPQNLISYVLWYATYKRLVTGENSTSSSTFRQDHTVVFAGGLCISNICCLCNC